MTSSSFTASACLSQTEASDRRPRIGGRLSFDKTGVHSCRTGCGPRALSLRLGAFRRDQHGVALVEFTLLLPMLLLVFAVIIEGSRMMLSYQTVIAGVRDATRYLARVVPGNICVTGGSVGGYATRLQAIVAQSIGGASVLPSGVTVVSVTPSYACSGSAYRGGAAPVATVTANLRITFPFGSVLTLFGSSLPTISTTVTDRSRIFGA